MDKQALLQAIANCRKTIAGGAGPNRANMNWDIVQRGVFGLRIIETLLSEPEKVEGLQVHVIEIQGDSKQQNPWPACPRCENEEIAPETKYCKICGFPLFIKN